MKDDGSDNDLRYKPSVNVLDIPDWPGYLVMPAPPPDCEVCGTPTEKMFFVDGMARCYGCARRWRATPTGVVLRLAAVRR